MVDLLRKLMEAQGVSGNEAEVRNIIIDEIKKHVDEITVDEMGNLIAHKKGDLPRVMLAAHMDEIGLIIKNIDPDGSIYFTSVGGIEPLTLIGQRVNILAKKELISGVITVAQISNDETLKNLPSLEELFVDTGMSKAELDECGVEMGSYMTIIQESGYMSNDQIIYGKALDDRIGCYILIQLAKHMKGQSETFYVFTVQEEVGLYGAKTTAYKIRPDWAIAVDATNANDKTSLKSNIVGKGPCITLKDAGMITNRCINSWIRDIASKNNIPLQIDVNEKGTTDALSISLSRGGVPSSVMSIAVRNLHSAVGIASISDIDNAVKILLELLKDPPKTCIV